MADRKPYARLPKPVVQVQVPVDDLVRLLELANHACDEDPQQADIDMIEGLKRKAGIYARLQDGR